MQPLTQCIYLIYFNAFTLKRVFLCHNPVLLKDVQGKQTVLCETDGFRHLFYPQSKFIFVELPRAAVDATRQRFSRGQWAVWQNLHKTEVKCGERLCEFGKSTFCSALWIWTAANPGKPHLGPNASYICMHMCVGLNMYLFLWRSER